MPDIVRQGWTIRAHALFLNQLEAWILEVEAERDRAAGTDNPLSYQRKATFKLVMVVRKLMLSVIPSNPLDVRYRHGGTANIPAHIFRAKFGDQRYRLFFQARQGNRRIVYVWVNCKDTLRTYDARTDAYVVFSSLLKREVIPSAWEDLNDAIGAAEKARLDGFVDRAE